MKKFLIILMAAVVITACSNGETGDRTYDTQTVTDSADDAPGPVMDTTPTINNNAYNPDSAMGQGTTYDTSATSTNKQ